MKFFAQTAFQYIRKQIEAYKIETDMAGKMLFVMPSVPIEVAIRLGSLLQDYCTEHQELSSPLIKIASDLCREWELAIEPAVRQEFAQVQERQWADQRGNLTSYRNIAPADDLLLVVLLIGADRVTDASSLADFHHCDHSTIWNVELKRSFSTWLQSWLEESSVAFEDETIAHIDEILQPLVERGLADILQLSLLLENLNLVSAQDGRDAESILLSGLGCFGLPSFIGFRFSGRKSFGPYLDDAVSFFSYDKFLEDRSRQSALRTIKKFVHHNELGELFDVSEREPYRNDQEFIEGLRRYIETRDSESRTKLLQCDYVTIRDKILGFRPPKEPPPPKETIKKLSGSPIEVVLTALWRSLGEFKRTAAEHGVFAHEALRKIRIESRLFKHDCDGESADERRRNAQVYIKRLLGGVDKLIEDWLSTAGLGGAGEDIKIHSRLVRQDLDCQSARTSEPFLHFTVELFGDSWDEPVVNHFAWRLPEIESYRVADVLLQWAGQEINDVDGYCLPVFHVSYYEELMLAKDDEETRRILLQCIKDEGKSIVNLLAVSEIDSTDLLLPYIQKLAFNYDQFVQATRTNGLHAALQNEWDDLRKAYEQVCEAFLSESACANSPLAAFLFRSFLIPHRRASAESNRWAWDYFEPSAVVTILHPALLEMLQAHIHYLLTSFGTVAKHSLRSPSKRAFRDVVWRNYVDLAAIQMPLCGLIRNRNKVLDTDIRGEDLIHRIGDIGTAEASLTTRLLLRYDAFDEDEISDTELFRETRESLLIYRILSDYRKLHPHAEDGLSIAVYQNQNIQPVIAAVDEFLTDVSKDRGNECNDYAMAVTVFTESSDDTSVSRWINQWKERWEAAETQGALAHYRRSHLSVAHRIVSPDNYYRQFTQLILEGLQVDIAILNDFVVAGAEGNVFELVERYDVTARTLKFPVLEKPFCSSRDPGRQLQRARVLSNRQFRISTLHAEVMARLKSPEMPQNTNHIVLGFGDYMPWQGVVDALHEKAEWVVCIDPNIDERLVASKGRNTEKAREIIGFGSGVGSHGEANYTISTEQFSLSDVLQRLTAAVGEIYSGWDRSSYESVTAGVLAEATRLSGLSLVRATGIGQYIRDFMAYALCRKILKADDNVLCDQIVSLDAYRHWFDAADSDTRPDLLWLVARIGEEGCIQLDLRLIECKLARMSDTHLEKARQQLENGLQHLVTVFKPRIDSDSTEDDRPDQRYWWLQLHRLIASKAEISNRERARVLTALERLAEGNYSIEWHASAVTFWTDQLSGDISLSEEWLHNFEGQQLGIGVVSSGSEFVKKVCASGFKGTVPWSQATLHFEAEVQQTVSAADKGEGEEDTDDTGGSKQEPTGRPPGTEPGAVESSSTRPQKKKVLGKRSVEQLVNTIPDRILLGTSVQGSRRVYWEFGHKDLSNRHMLIFGTSGMGKTYAIQCLLCELGRTGMNSLIIDYTNGFLPKQLEQETRDILAPKQHIVRQAPLPISPFRLQTPDLGGDMLQAESFSTAAKRITAIFQTVYNLGEQQFSVLFDAISEGLIEQGEHMSLSALIGILEGFSRDPSKNKNIVQTTLSKIKPFIMDRPFECKADGLDWLSLFGDVNNRCHVFQLAGLDYHTWRLVAEFVLWDLYAYLQTHGRKDEPKVLVLDEVQNLDQKDSAPLAKYLREGRKFGVSLIMATQIMSNLGKDERDRLFNAGHKLFFRPVDTEIKSYAEIGAISTGDRADVWGKRLANLQKGECYSLGPSLNEATGNLEIKAFKIQIASLREREFNG